MPRLEPQIRYFRTKIRPKFASQICYHPDKVLQELPGAWEEESVLLVGKVGRLGGILWADVIVDLDINRYNYKCMLYMRYKGSPMNILVC